MTRIAMSSSPAAVKYFYILHAGMGMAGQERHLDADRLESFAKRVLRETI
jgi:hypothetical protein